MEGATFLPLMVLLTFACFVMANNKTFRLEELSKSQKNGSEEHDESGFSADGANKLLELLRQEGKKGWLKKAKQMAKQKAKEMENENPEQSEQNDFNSTYEFQDAGPPTQLIATVKNKLTVFSGPLVDRVKGSITNLNKKWKNLSSDDKKAASDTLAVISTNIQKFGNAGEDPVGAIKAAVDIIASIASNFGPKGQLLSMGLGFVSALLGLFGKGTKSKPLGQVVREQIDEALSEYRDEDLSAKAQGLVKALRDSKSYLDGAAKSGKPLSELEMGLVATRVPIVQGAEFLGELSTVITNIFKSNKGVDGRKCMKYFELFAQMTSIRDMILTQLISLSSNKPNLQNDVNGLIAYRQNFRDASKELFEKLYTIDYDSNIMPYFDPDVSVITDIYSTNMLNLGKYDRSMAGLYCLLTLKDKNDLEDLGWETRYDRYRLDDKPYTQRVPRSDDNCYWKLVPHGSNVYSIVNKYKCDGNCDKYGKYSDWMLSWTTDDDEAFATLATDKPVLWKIWGYDYRYIRNQRGCGQTKSKWCNYDLRVKNKKRRYFLHTLNLPIGQLLPSESKYYWKIKRKP